GDVFDYSAVVTNDGPAPIVPQNVTANAVGADIVVAWEPAPSLEEVSNAANTVDGAYAWKNKVSTIHPNKIALAESRLGPNNTNSRDAGDTCEEAIEAIAGDNSATGADQWFTYTATMTGSMNITSCLAGQLQDTRLTVYDACETLVQVAYNDDAYCSAITGGNSYASDVTFDIVAGETYKIFWDDYWSPAAFTWNLSESEPVDPCAGLVDVNEPNDTMADATDASAGGTFAAAICPAGESDMYMVNAVAGGTISLATAVATTPGIDTKVYLYDASGVQLGYNDDFGGLTSFVDLLVPADGIYYFEVVAYSASQVFDYSATVVNDDPPAYIPTYSVLRDGVELATGLETQTYTDAGVTVSVEYCYTVTQVLADATVSAPSDPACAMVMPGGTCDLAIAATEGDDGNEATGDEQWFMYTTTLTGTLTATTCYAGQTEDTDVDVYTSCDAASPLASSDDAFCSDVTGGNNWASEVTIDVVAGETYYFFWDDTWNPGPFTWYLYETPPPTEPTDLVAQGGMGYAYLTWNGVEPLAGAQSSNFDFNQNEVQSQEQEYYNEKKANIATPAPANTTASFSIGDYSSSSSRDDHALDVTFLCDFGSWQEEVGWSIVDASGVVVASGIAPDEQTVTGLAEGTYTVYATDTFGDGWNGNTLFAYTAVAGSDTLTHLRWSLGTGGGLDENGELAVITGPEFMVSEELSDLTFSQFAYNPVTDAFDVTVTNTGLQNAWTVGMTLDLDVEGAGTCDAPPAWGQFGFPQVAPAQEIVLELPFVTNYFINNLNTGYGDFTVVAMIDAGCTEFEVDETNNVSETLVSLTDPFDGITWNVYRAEDGAELSFNSVATLVDVQEYLDDNDGAGLLGGDYVYYVTQVAADGFESDPSNYADASVYGSEDFPPPVDLMGEADGFEVMLEWTAPDLTAWEPPSLTANYSPIPAGTKPYITPPAAPVSSTRQGGDTFDSAVSIDVLPYENSGTTVGYTADYGPYDDAINAGLLCEYTGWVGNTGAAADVVYSLSLTEPTNLQISACGSLYDTALGVFTMEDDGTGTMVPVLLAANDDFCDLQSEITCEFPAGDIYIVISGYSTSEGDYVLAVNNLDLESPVVGYGVYRDGEMVGMTDHVDSTSYNEFAYDPLTPEGAELEYVVTAMYGDFDIESPSAPVTVTTSLPEFVCAGPQNLTAEALSNNVELRWDAPEGGPTWFGHYNGTFNGGVGTGAAAVFSMAARFDAEMLFDLNGMQLTQVSFIPNEVLSTYKVMIYDAAGVPVDSTDALNGADLVMGEWVDVELPNPVNIVWTEDLIFGVKMVAETGYPGGIDNGPANVGMGDLIDLGAGWGSMFELYALDFNWALEGYADYASVEGLSIAPTDLPLEVSEAISAIQVESRLLTEPIQTEHANISANRELLGYNVYRNDEQIATNILPVFTVFVDDWVPFGDHHYYLTALYNNTEECGESENSDTAMVTLVNTPPGAVDLLTPADGSTVVVTPDNMDDEVQFFWTQAADADNDVVHYHMHAMGHFEGDTLMEMEAPMMAQANPSFEDNADTDTPLAPWGTWPPENTNFSFETEGNGIYNSDQTLMVYDGMHCLKVYGQYGETMPNVTPIYQGHSVEALGLQAGDAVAIEGQMMSHADDWVGQGANRAYLFLSFFDADWNFLGSSLSNMMDKTMPASEWHQFFALAVVPEGAVNMNAGVEYHQESGGDHGSVYFDDVNMFIPVTESILRVSHSDLVMAAMQDSVHHLTVEWDVAAMDVWDMTPSNNGPFTVTLDLSATLGIDESTLPDVFALYNNYPNPFNPVTNITYDIPEVSNVTLEIYNVMGQKVRTLVAGSHEPGRYRVLWNATNDFGEGLSSGMYIYKIQAGDFVNVKKLILMK
ncbi:T9SS type A sorting domain-containing protein, partial [Candidatus Marinimicrobia bacterium]|nr:T9SS type A sorting domain-containing protein [Candidatus Neomarinimicrobiota bacterium]